jgi:4-amino-4-deoxy-L-arabinose transferase-like glycosyltransferase
VIFLAGAVLRFSTLSLQSYWIDEALTGWEVRRSLGGLIGGLPGIEASPPLYFVSAWLWVQLFGAGDAALRALSAVAGVAVIPVAYLAARELLSVRAGLLAAALAACNPGLVWYSQEARPYALAILLSGLAFLFFLRALAHGPPGERRWDMRLWAGSSVLAMATHYFAWFPVAVEAAWLWAAAGRGARRLPAANLLRTEAAVACAGILLVPLAVYQRTTGGGADLGAIADESFFKRLRDAGSEAVLGAARPDYLPVVRAVEAILVVTLALVLLRGTRAQRRALRLSLGVAGAAIVIPTVLDVFGARYINERNLLPALVPLLVGIAIALSTARPRWLGPALAGALCALSLLVWWKIASDRSVQREDWRAAARALASPARDRVIVIAPDLQNPAPVPRLVTLEARYAPHVHPLSRRGATVAEIDVLDVRGAPGGAPSPCTEAPPPRPAPGFHLMGHTGNCNYDLFRFVADHPVQVTATQLNGEQLLAGGTTVAFQAAGR